MAHIRGDSTIGGKPIVSLDMMNTFVEQIQGVGLKAKINKYENDKLSSLSDADTIGVDKEKNGFWEVNGDQLYNGMYPQGQLANLSNTNSKFQLYAPQKEDNKSALYFRTGKGNSLLNWERVATKTMLETGLNTKVDNSDGHVNNLTVETQFNAYDDVYLGNINLFKTGFFLGSTVGELDSCSIYPSSNNGITLKAGYTEFTVEDAKFKYGNYDIWHSGNLTPNDYLEKKPKILIAGSDVLVLTTTGYWICNNPTGVPSNVTGLVYIDVINYNDNNVLQKIYSSDGNYVYSRTLNNGTWNPWKSLVGTLSYTKDITAANWSQGTDMYEMTVTHNLNSENIISVIVTDSNKMSMFTGFQVISPTVIKVFSATNPAGKIVINAIQ